MRAKLCIFILFFATIFYSSCRGQSSKSDDPIIYAEAEDPELEKAKQGALSNLNIFIQSFNTHANDTILQYSLKADFIENDTHEHMWISLNKIENELYYGVLGNEPQLIKNIKYGDVVKITRSQIEDWLIVNTKTNDFEGGYSVKVLLKREK
jgi:uncharacterized protein YegJ (DUF2314 family)